MKSNTISRMLAVSCCALMLSANVAAAQTPTTSFQPHVGQSGKDVVWVPTPQELVDRMLDMAKVTVDDLVYDLGSGDGRTVITAARRGIRARGVEFNNDMVQLSKRNAAEAGVTELATFTQGDIFKTDFSEATVVTLFLLSTLNIKLRPILLDMKPGTRVVSNTFGMGDWNPDQVLSAGNGCTSYCRASLWIIPAKVQGTWSLPEGELTLEQKYQMLTGNLKTANGSTAISSASMNGDQITFTVGDRIFRGKVDGKRMEGVFGTETRFEATRKP